jgi:hypothetical protein
VGKKILVNNYPMEIVGVSAAGFAGLDPARSPDIRFPILMAPVMTPGHDELGNGRSQMDTDVRSPEAGIYSRIGPRLFAAIVPSNPAAGSGRTRAAHDFIARS